MGDFDKSFLATIGHEGGYVNDLSDPGGETKYGVSKRAYPDLDIKNLTLEQAKGIYYKDYWLATGCDSLIWPMNFIAFDTAVNMGVSTSKSNLKECPTFVDYLFERLEDYCDIVDNRPVSLKYLKGWVRRVISLYRAVRPTPHPISEEYK